MKISGWMMLGVLAIAAGASDKAQAQSLREVLFAKDDGKSSEETASPDAASGIREALMQGSALAIETLGQKDGFLASEFRIPVPDQVESIAKAARSLGQGTYVDAFEESMNRAAEQAVPAAADIFSEAIGAMTIEDAFEIVRGEPDAATSYFRRTSADTLFEALNPIVAEATSQAGVTRAYKDLSKRGGGFLSAVMDPEDLDLDRYVTHQSIDALFAMIAREEARIREDPVARTTDLLKQVFGGN